MSTSAAAYLDSPVNCMVASSPMSTAHPRIHGLVEQLVQVYAVKSEDRQPALQILWIALMDAISNTFGLPAEAPEGLLEIANQVWV
ncbi:hypothetical protein [Synechococcus sp. KORDI-52]|uniref:hypothetical protein n=1 Tax=Synechococcus sp. KORDI-52 TaxID=585425 RepID=UPI0012EB51DD|nr:hypothetical protein [Synechococcus sp. KORDI-52]